MRGALLLASVVGMLVTTVFAQSNAPVIRSKPIFVPGLYETEGRDSAIETEGVKKRTCIASADFDAFRRETIARYLALPQFMAVCKLSDTKDLPDGFAFAMNCIGAQTIIAFHFKKDFFSSTTDTKVVARPEYSSSILTLSRRVGDCSGKPAPPPGTDL